MRCWGDLSRVPAHCSQRWKQCCPLDVVRRAGSVWPGPGNSLCIDPQVAPPDCAASQRGYSKRHGQHTSHGEKGGLREGAVVERGSGGARRETRARQTERQLHAAGRSPLVAGCIDSHSHHVSCSWIGQWGFANGAVCGVLGAHDWHRYPKITRRALIRTTPIVACWLLCF